MAIPKNDSDPFIKFGKVFSLTRGIWQYSDEVKDSNNNLIRYKKAEMIGMLAIQIQHYFIYNLI